MGGSRLKNNIRHTDKTSNGGANAIFQWRRRRPAERNGKQNLEMQWRSGHKGNMNKTAYRRRELSVMLELSSLESKHIEPTVPASQIIGLMSQV
ncbi:hypothetical protein OSJ77_15615 [Phyllobacterium sp. 0TCS1.6C]|uniref:hypothetical protein n=1 Tax=unclassified Phyllobacterium TaxID=2638441 RepID=UPI002263BCDA|nr:MULTISPECIES: hypothetical protein [unclassified Phyllobacterium]MCX8281621.1 hypothetical protein [Phyllobacterium sp. 0TCS1.6C]MCX8294731.1 hypothetical protein [Phyllobacterium sp. 0TCS1.6A]